MNDTSAPQIPPTAPAESPEAAAHPIIFSGVRRDFWRLIVRGAMLELVTLGFYRFWLATDMRRHFWSHTSVDGDAPEYTGTAMELLIGFLFALAILVPLNLIYFFLALEVELWKAFASIPLLIFVFLFYQFARYRARRYRLTRTIWRGVRFWMKGSGWSYAWRAGLWTLLAFLTLGLALPWYQAALERFKMGNSFYGDLPGRFEGTGGGLFRKVWWLWAATVLMIAAIGGLAWLSPAATAPFGALISIWLPFGYAIYKACEWRWWVSGIRFGDLRFASNLRNVALVHLYWIVIGLSWAVTTVLFMWIGAVFGAGYLVVRAGGGGAEGFAALAQNPVAMGLFIFVFVLGYLACALAFGVVMRMYLVRDVWARVAASTVVHNLAAADNVVARGDTVSALGEGFADSLDIGGF
jgi:uncharacterized membrane protein YjgN (DUF898 family)